MGKHPLQKVRDHVSFRGLSIDVSANISVDSRSIYRPLCWQILGPESSGVLLSLTYWSTDRSTVGRDSLSSVSTIYWWIVSWVSVRYQWCISQQSASPRVGQYIHRVMFYCWSSIGQQVNQQSAAIASVACHQSIGELLVDYIWYVISGVSVNNRYCFYSMLCPLLQGSWRQLRHNGHWCLLHISVLADNRLIVGDPSVKCRPTIDQ